MIAFEYIGTAATSVVATVAITTAAASNAVDALLRGSTEKRGGARFTGRSRLAVAVSPVTGGLTALRRHHPSS
jgi:hypothetical protein